MTKVRGYFEVARWETTVYVRVVGLANFNNSHLFKEFVDEMLERGYRRFFVDLGPCQGIDSTFMGVLIGIHLFPKSTSEAEQTSVAVVNANAHNLRVLGDLGLTKLITVADAQATLPPGIGTERLLEEAYDPQARIQLIRRAHENLIQLDEQNRAKFGPFLEALTRELQAKS